MSAHEPGPWHLIEQGSVIDICRDFNGRASGNIVVGSTTVRFRAPRQGSHRGETMVYRPFSDEDRATARLIAAAPELLAVLKKAQYYLVGITSPGMDWLNGILVEVDAAIAKAEGR
jgi:hypothetical protein